MTIISAVTNGNYTHVLDVTLVTQNVSANTSTISYNYYVNRNVAAGSGAFAGSPGRSFTAVIDGVTHSVTTTFDFRSASAISFVSGSQVVTHQPDGTHTVTGSFSGPATFVSAGFPATSGSGSLTLPTIPRASIPTFSSNPVDAGTSVTITTNRADPTFTHEIDYAFGSQSGTVGVGVGASTTWIPPLILLNEIPNTTSGTATITVKTFDSSSNLLGTTNTALTLTVPTAATPTISSVTATEATTSPNVASIVGGFVQGISTLAVAIVGAAGIYGSTIVSSFIQVGAVQIIAGSSGTSTAIQDTGTVAIIGTVTDSRGRVTSTTHNVTVLTYAPPTVTAATAKRALVGGSLDPNGTYMSVNIVAAVQSLVVGSQKNDLTYSVKKQARGGTTPWSSITPDSGPTDAHSTGLSTTFTIGTYSVSNSYDVRIEVTDALGVVTAVQSTFPTGGVLIHFSNTSDTIGVGKYVTATGASIDAQLAIYQNNGNLVIDVTNLATTATAGIAKLSTDAQAIAGTDTATAVTPHALAAATLSSLKANASGLKNLVINGNFRTNQRAYVSAASLASGSYGFDRWKSSTASSSFTFTASPQGQTVTINSGGSFEQLIERASIPAATYTLSWSGTATGRIYNSGATAPSYAASPITVAIDGTQNVVVEFTASGATKTLGTVQLEAGSTQTPYELMPLGEELLLCRRYYRIFGGGLGLGTAAANATTILSLAVTFEPPMRTTPTATVSGQIAYTDFNTGNYNSSSLSISAQQYNATGGVLYLAGATGLTAGRVYAPNAPSGVAGTGFISFDAEL